MVTRKKSGLGADPFKSQPNLGIFSPTEPLTQGDDQDEDSTPLTVGIAKIVLPQQQPRRYFDPAKMQQLVASVRHHGILEPLLVRPRDDSYELIAGERRYRAAKDVGLTDVPVVIREMSDQEALQIAIVENLQREDLNPLEETEGIIALLSMQLQIEQQEVSHLLHRLAKASDNVVGKDREQLDLINAVFDVVGGMDWKSFASHRLPLMNLPKPILDALRKGKIEYTKARAIARVKDTKKQEELLDKTISQTLSLAQIKEQISALKAEKKPEDDANSLKEQIDDVLRLARLVKRSRVWEDPQKRRKLEKVLAELQSIVGDTN
ncbi:ParB/RepB/Spo0J family partition protein [Leptolyngbya sp. AN02str]|uniref:ParB/RepB/Spo0J family partition protein n=1 Tax=Leptolyngbya sp. AN02str TaxID=3423363 RepID=UPI003D31DCC3